MDSDEIDFYIGENPPSPVRSRFIEIGRCDHKFLALGNTKVKCKFVTIANRSGHPSFHFEIDGQMYFYGILGIKEDYKIILRCTENRLRTKCRNTSSILPTEFLKLIIRNNSKTIYYPKSMDNWHPRVYDTNNYDINSFDICGGHNHPGTKLDVYFKESHPEMPVHPVVSPVKIENFAECIEKSEPLFDD